MARLTITRFGAPAEVVTLDTTATPAPGPGQLLVRMEAATINDSDFLLIRGQYPVRPSLPSPVGTEGVGRVVAAGPSTSTELVGRRVLILPTYEQGAWADEVVVSTSDVVAVDGSADPAQLAMTGINPATAWGLLHRFEQLSPGDWVGQTAANGATGRFVIALAERLGLRTLNVVRREAAAQALRDAGAAHVVVGDEGITDAVSAILGDDELALVLDAVGGSVVSELAHALRFGGKVVSYAVLSGEPPEVSVFDKIFKEVAATGFWVVNWLRTAPRSEVLDTYRQLAALVAGGELSAPVEATYRLEDYRAAFEHAAATERGGKILFRFDA